MPRVVRPDSVEEVAAVIRICAQHDVTVVPQAGNTGLVGGSVPRPAASGARAAIVLSLTRLTRLGAVDTAAMQVTAEAGVTFTTWRERLVTPASIHQWTSQHATPQPSEEQSPPTPADLGCCDSAPCASRSLASKQSPPKGAIVGSLGGLPKETAGLHWPSLLAGSEGTLAVITAARLRLVPWFQHTTTALVAVESIAAGTRLLATLRQSLTSLDAVEVIAPAAMRLVSEHLGRQPPVSSPEAVLYVMIDCADHGDPSEQLLDVLSQADGIIDSAVTTDAVQRERLVAFRDRITEAIAAASTEAGVPTFKLDVAVPLDALAQLIEVAQDAADADGCRLIPFGHLAEATCTSITSAPHTPSASPTRC